MGGDTVEKISLPVQKGNSASSNSLVSEIKWFDTQSRFVRMIAKYQRDADLPWIYFMSVCPTGICCSPTLSFPLSLDSFIHPQPTPTVLLSPHRTAVPTVPDRLLWAHGWLLMQSTPGIRAIYFQCPSQQPINDVCPRPATRNVSNKWCPIVRCLWRDIQNIFPLHK